MPLSHHQSLDPRAFGVSEPFNFFGDMRPKRKLEMGAAYDQMEAADDWKEQIDNSLANPKRLCLHQTKESQMTELPQAETQMTLPGCLDDSVTSHSQKPAPTGAHEESQPGPRTTNFHIFDMEEDLSHPHHDQQQQLQAPQQTTAAATSPDSPAEDDLATSMETDFVPDNQQYNLSPPHTPADSATAAERYCACLSCKGLKPSPVSGRMHCHCYASWRGMYGIDCSFYNDYY